VYLFVILWNVRSHVIFEFHEPHMSSMQKMAKRVASNKYWGVVTNWNDTVWNLTLGFLQISSINIAHSGCWPLSKHISGFQVTSNFQESSGPVNHYTEWYHHLLQNLKNLDGLPGMLGWLQDSGCGDEYPLEQLAGSLWGAAEVSTIRWIYDAKKTK